jgi:hypothetical protein
MHSFAALSADWRCLTFQDLREVRLARVRNHVGKEDVSVVGLLVDNRRVGEGVCTCKRKKRGSRVYPTDKRSDSPSAAVEAIPALEK